MKKSISLFIFTQCVVLLTSMSGRAQRVEETPQEITEHEIDTYGDGYAMVVVDRSELAKVRNAIDYFLLHARESMAEGKTDEAIFELTTAAAYMRLDAGRGKNEVQTHVFEAADNLDTIAADIESGSKSSMEVMDGAVFEAHRALARYHQQRAHSLLNATFTEAAGYALQAAVVHYDHAAVSKASLDNSEAPADLEKNVSEWEGLAKLLMEGKVVRSSGETLQRIADLGIAISALSHKEIG